MAELKGVHHFALTVTDLARSTRWYEGVLGLAVLREVEVAGVAFVTLRSSSGELILTLYQHPANRRERFEETHTGLDHISFGVASRAELKEWSGRLSENGVDHSPVAEDPFGAVLVFRDPDNIQLELVAPS
jgi:catechol 2,3-dioxygenase-like lactoylglutathione lyase family enzyme